MVYKQILNEKLGLINNLYCVEAPTGLIGGTLSHEYHLKNNSNEAQLLNCSKCKNLQIFESNSNKKCKKCEEKIESQEIFGTVEIAHTFNLGQKYSKIFDSSLFMCCFGIGLTRLIPAR